MCLTVEADDAELAGEPMPAPRAPTPATACCDDDDEVGVLSRGPDPKDAGKALDDAVAVIARAVDELLARR